MNNHLQFTRYLYVKDEVKYSLLIASLLNKKEEANFWMAELFYSEFYEELIELIWSIYYDFYYSKNTGFEKYLFNKFKELNKYDIDNYNTECYKIFYTCVQNLMIRPFSLDVFLLKKLSADFNEIKLKQETLKQETLKKEIQNALQQENYVFISSLILYNHDSINILKILITLFINYGLKLDEQKTIKEYIKMSKYHDKKTLLLARFANYVTIYKKMHIGKNIYLHINFESINMYNTNYTIKPYKVLPLACIYNIDNDNYHTIFNVKRKQEDLENAYRYNWLYYASFSPLWKKRITEFNGTIYNEERKVQFMCEEDEEQFYDKYGYEPDEQQIEVQNKSIQKIIKQRDIGSFYKEYKNNGFLIDFMV